MANIIDAGGGGGYDIPITTDPTVLANTNLIVNGSAEEGDTTGWFEAVNVSIANIGVSDAKSFLLADNAVLAQVITDVGYTPIAFQFMAKYKFPTPPDELDNNMRVIITFDVQYEDDSRDSFNFPCLKQQTSINGWYSINVMCNTLGKPIQALSVGVQTLSVIGGMYVEDLVLQKSTGIINNVDNKVEIRYATVDDDLKYTFEGDTIPSKEDFIRINYTPKSGDTVVVRKQGTSNVILGKLGDGVGGGDTNIIPITFSNGIGIYWSTYVTVTFNLPLSKDNININYLAFTIKGKELGVQKTYATSGVLLLDDYRIGIACADYKNVDDFMTVSYDESKGNLRSIEGQAVISFDGQFAPLYLMPKVNMLIPYVNIPLINNIKEDIGAITETPLVETQIPINNSINEFYVGIPIGYVNINIATLTDSITAIKTP